MPSLCRATALTLLPLVALAASLATGCEETSRAGTPPAASEAPTGPADATYTARGRVADVIGDEVSIQHEAIPSFENRDGETVGMMTMTMAFYRPEGVSMEGIAEGDAVEFTFEMRWEGDHRLTLAAIQKLPEGTELTL